jgi:hypothetical protein
MLGVGLRNAGKRPNPHLRYADVIAITRLEIAAAVTSREKSELWRYYEVAAWGKLLDTWSLLCFTS